MTDEKRDLRDRAPTSATERSTHFKFEHKLFSVEGGYFSPARDSKETVFHIPLGEIRGAVPLDVLRSEFGILHDSPDGKLLGIIDRSLRFVKEIRPGDSIPRELLDGTASWTVEPKHRDIAKNRLTVQLVSWMTGQEAAITVEQLAAIVSDPETKGKVQQAFTEIAEELGIGRENRQQVVDRVDVLARELAYIEALRDRYSRVRAIAQGINGLIKAYHNDRTTSESLERMRRLIRPPLAAFEGIFAQVDAQTGEILSLLKDADAQIAYIREARDELHTRLMAWDDIITQWRAFKPLRSDYSDELIRNTYRFLAQHFPQVKPWKLGMY